MWESQMLLTDGKVVFPWVLQFLPTFYEWQMARYKYSWKGRKTQIKKKVKILQYSLKLQYIC